MIATLKVLAKRKPKDGWIDIRNVDVRGGDYAKLAYWGLIEPHFRLSTVGKVGWWRLTPLGRQFVTGEVVLPKFLYVYNGKVVGTDPMQVVHIREYK